MPFQPKKLIGRFPWNRNTWKQEENRNKTLPEAWNSMITERETGT
jgi:hypothetical protein